MEPRTRSGQERMVRVREWAGSHAELVTHELTNVLAIEAEARAALLDELEAAVRGLRGKWVGSRGYPGDHHGIEYVDVDAVLALIQQHREEGT